jgi:hypothetical protein
MNMMTTPGFTAEASLYASRGYRRHASQAKPYLSEIVPAIPFCGNCDYILDNCERNGWRPRAVCNACAIGDCYSGVEDPTPEDPTTPNPWGRRNWIGGGF